MFVRYGIESVSFVCLALIFQYFIGQFNKDTHKIVADKEHLAGYDVNAEGNS
jgi:hypothetical protein